MAEDLANENQSQRLDIETGQDDTVDPSLSGESASSITAATTTTKAPTSTATTSVPSDKRSSDTPIEEIDLRVGDKPEIVRGEDAQGSTAADASMMTSVEAG